MSAKILENWVDYLMLFLTGIVFVTCVSSDLQIRDCKQEALKQGFFKYKYMNGICFGINDKKAKMLYKLGQK